jgi:hypothetical protein
MEKNFDKQLEEKDNVKCKGTDPEEVYECAICLAWFDNEEDLVNHLTDHGRPIGDEYQGLFQAFRSMYDENSLKAEGVHWPNRGCGEAQTIPVVKPGRFTKQYPCKFASLIDCTQNLKSSTALRSQHLSAHGGEARELALVSSNPKGKILPVIADIGYQQLEEVPETHELLVYPEEEQKNILPFTQFKQRIPETVTAAPIIVPRLMNDLIECLFTGSRVLSHNVQKVDFSYDAVTDTDESEDETSIKTGETGWVLSVSEKHLGANEHEFQTLSIREVYNIYVCLSPDDILCIWAPIE